MSPPSRTPRPAPMPAEAPAAPEVATQELTYREAVRLALEHEMAADPTVLLFGEDVGEPGGPFKTTEGLLQRFGPNRVLDTPTAENCFLVVRIGLAAKGLSPRGAVTFTAFLV